MVGSLSPTLSRVTYHQCSHSATDLWYRTWIWRYQNHCTLCSQWYFSFYLELQKEQLLRRGTSNHLINLDEFRKVMVNQVFRREMDRQTSLRPSLQAASTLVHWVVHRWPCRIQILPNPVKSHQLRMLDLSISIHRRLHHPMYPSCSRNRITFQGQIYMKLERKRGEMLCQGKPFLQWHEYLLYRWSPIEVPCLRTVIQWEMSQVGREASIHNAACGSEPCQRTARLIWPMSFWSFDRFVLFIINW